MAYTVPPLPTRDAPVVNIHDEQELQKWADAFDVTPAELRATVRLVGVRIEVVQMYLRNRGSKRRSSRGDA